MNNSNATGSNPWKDRFKSLAAGLRRGLPFLGGALALLAAIFIYNLVLPGPAPLTERQVNQEIAQAMASATAPPPFSSLVYKAIQPSLVLIQTHGSQANGESADGLGSGVVIDQAGDILTSLHVVDGATRITVTFADGMGTGALVIAQQPENDIAVLQPEKQPTLLVPAVLGNPNASEVGDEAFVVGNPFGLYSSLSAGVISGFNRTFKVPDSSRELHGMIQIDAAVNPGNSGGPLLNRYGQVIGIVTGIVNPTKENFFVGIGFAVPIDIAGGAAGMPPY